MRLLRATECISPAIDRTKLILFSPFRKGRTWKLCATAYLCRIGTVFFPFPLIYLFFLPALLHKGKFAIAALCAGVLVFTILWTWVFHLCSRLQFAFFDIVVNREQFVAPAWRKYRAQALSWTGYKILIGLALTLLAALPIAAIVRHVIPIFLAMPKSGQTPSPQFAAAILGVYAAYFGLIAVFGIVFLVFSLLSDFIVPSLALENTGIKEAFRRMAELVRREPGQFALYTLLKVLLGFVGYMGAILAWEITFVIITLIVGGVIFLIGFLLHLAGMPHVISHRSRSPRRSRLVRVRRLVHDVRHRPGLHLPRRLRPLLPRRPLPPPRQPAGPIRPTTAAIPLPRLSPATPIHIAGRPIHRRAATPGAPHLASAIRN